MKTKCEWKEEISTHECGWKCRVREKAKKKAPFDVENKNRFDKLLFNAIIYDSQNCFFDLSLFFVLHIDGEKGFYAFIPQAHTYIHVWYTDTYTHTWMYIIIKLYCML